MYGIVVYIPISKGAERSLVLPEESVSGCNRPDRREWRGGKMKRDTLAHALTFLRTDTNTQTRTHTYITHTNTHTHTHTCIIHRTSRVWLHAANKESKTATCSDT